MSENKKLKIVSVVVVVALFVGLAVPASAASASDPYSTTWSVLTNINDLSGLPYTYFSYYIQYPDDLDHRFTWWYAMLDVLTDFATDSEVTNAYIKSMYNHITVIDQIYSLLNGNNGISSINSQLSVIGSNIIRIRDSIAPSYRSLIERYQEDNIDQVTDDFLSGEQSSSSLGTEDFSDLQSFTSGAGVMLASPATADQFSSALSSGVSSSNGLKFFTQAVKDDLTVDSVRGSSEVYLDFLSSRLEEVEDFLGGASR